MNISAHPLWLVGFRPLFALACLSGLSLPVLWALLFSGVVSAPPMPFSLIQWHAHEMFFGFGWAVLGGFLLTSTKNWVGQRGFHGAPLIFLAAAWLFERAGMWFSASWPPLLFRLSSNLFLTTIVAMLLWTLIRYRKDDSYRDNLFFLLVLPAYLLAKNLLLDADYFAIGSSMTIGLFRMAFLLMLERTLTQFMKSIFQVSLLRNPLLDRAIKLLGLTLVFESFLPPWLASLPALLLALLLAGRFVFWKPQLAVRRLDVGIMYLGYLCMIAQLVVEAIRLTFQPAWVGSLSVHLFTFGVMGLIIPGMLIRISKGHTGRKVVFETPDKLALWLMIAAFCLRIIVPQLYPSAYTLWIDLAAACWFGCFSLLAWRYIPFLLQARVDGKVH